MACGSQRTISVDGAQITCKVPCVAEFSTSVSRFRNQMLNQILDDLRHYCTVGPVPTPPIVQEPVLLSETPHIVNVSNVLDLEFGARFVNSVNVSLKNIVFKIIGFSSVRVRFSGDAVIVVDYLGADALDHTQQMIVPFSEEVVIPGDFSPDSFVEGDIRIDNIINTNKMNSALTEIEAVRTDLSLLAEIRVLRMGKLLPNQPQILSETTHSIILPVIANLNVFAEHILKTDVRLGSVLFEIIGLSSAVVRISGEAVLTIEYMGVDSQNHSQQETMPFSTVETIPGNFPADSYVDGNLVLDNLINIPEEDPSIIAISAVNSTLFLSASIRILAVV